MPWPFDQGVGSQEAQQFVDTLQSSYDKILQDYQIRLFDARVQSLFPRSSFEARETLIIYTDDEDYSYKWKKAATEIQEMLDRAIRKKNSSLKIRVEIRNRYKMYQDTSSIIVPNSTAHKAFIKAESAVYEQVKKSCADLCTTISYHMRGPRWETEPKDRKPTLIVTVVPGSRSLWAFVQSHIEGALTPAAMSFGIDLYIEILPGTAQLLVSQEMAPPKPLILRRLPEMPVNGSSIGPRGCNTAAGSLGTWVYFQPAGNAEKQRCFLTCYHVISPGGTLQRTANDEYGVGLNGRKVETVMNVDYPASFDAMATKELLQFEIAQGGDPDGKKAKTVQLIDRYVSTNGIGSVIYASGNRKNIDGRRIDWALVNLHDAKSFPQNKPPAANFSPSQLFNGRLEYDVGPGEVVTRSGQLVKGDWVSKIGRGGTTTGEVNAMKAVVYWENGMESKEIEIASLPDSRGGAFVIPGDSGSMVFNLNKEWVGMSIGRLSLSDSGYITLVQDLVDDIRETTGGTISLP
jgi:hypothetical protein